MLHLVGQLLIYEETHVLLSKTFFFRKSCRFWDKVKNIYILLSRVGHSMRMACWISRVKNTLSEYVIILLSHCKNGCTNAPQYYVILIASLVYFLPSCSTHWLADSKKQTALVCDRNKCWIVMLAVASAATMSCHLYDWSLRAIDRSFVGLSELTEERIEQLRDTKPRKT